MSEPSDDITDQPGDGPRPNYYTGKPRPEADAHLPQQAPLPPPKSNTWLWVLLGVGIAIPVIMILFCGVLIMAVSKVRESAARAQSINNCKQICLAVNNICSTSTTGAIPPAYGPFPPGMNTNQSFFVSLLPYIELDNLYMNQVTSVPVKTYIAPADPNNPGFSGLISYGSNATVLTVAGNPTLPGSFGGRTANVIVVFERTAASGATWSNNKSYLTDTNGSSSPEFTGAASWSGYGSRATALTPAGCVVGMCDGSARTVTQSSANAGWAWAMDPSINGNSVPSGW